MVLAHNSADAGTARDAAQRGAAAGDNQRWLYLGRNYREMRRWDAALGPGFERIRYGALLQSIARAWRGPYLDWTAALGRRNDSLTWWSSRLAERNTYIQSLFHDICYLGVFLRLRGGLTPPALVVVESRPLLDTLAATPAGKNERLRVIGRRSSAMTWLAWVGWMVVVWGNELVQAVLSMAAARWSGLGRPRLPARSVLPRIVVHECLEESHFDGPGGGGDNYFRVLPDELRQRGYDVVVMPWLMNIRRTRLEAFRWFRKFPERYLIPEDFYSLSDYIWAGWVVVRQAALPRGLVAFEGLDVTTLVKGAARRGAADRGIAQFVRYVRLIKKLKARGYRMDVFLDKFENMLTEKPQVWAIRRYMPDVVTVGFQHYVALYPLQLHMFTTPAEAATAPHPDVLVCNSRFTADQLRDAGFRPSSLRRGPSLRYPHLLQDLRVPQAGSRREVLVVMPLEPLFAAELLDQLRQAFPSGEGVVFRLKTHPMMTEAAWQDAVGATPLSSHLVPAGGRIDDWIPQAACAVTSGSTAALEIALAGVPVVVVGRETDFDFNPLEWFKEFKAPVADPASLRTSVLACLAPDSTAQARAADWASSHRGLCVSPLNDATIGAFVAT